MKESGGPRHNKEGFFFFFYKKKEWAALRGIIDDRP